MLRLLMASVVSAILIASPVSTPTIPAECSAATTQDEPWIVTIEATASDAIGCLRALGLEGALAAVKAGNPELPVLAVPGGWEDVAVTVSFLGAGYPPNIVEVSAWYGAEHDGFHAVTTCLSADTFRSDGKPKNDTCAVTEDTDGNLTMIFPLPAADDSIGELTLFLQVQWYEPLNGATTSPHHINQWAITLRRD